MPTISFGRCTCPSAARNKILVTFIHLKLYHEKINSIPFQLSYNRAELFYKSVTTVNDAGTRGLFSAQQTTADCCRRGLFCKVSMHRHLFLLNGTEALFLQAFLKVIDKLWLMETLQRYYFVGYDIPFLFGPLLLFFP